MRVTARVIVAAVLVGLVGWFWIQPSASLPAVPAGAPVVEPSVKIQPVVAPVRELVPEPAGGVQRHDGAVEEGKRVSVAYEDVDWRQRAVDYVAETHPGNDIGHRTVLEVLKRFVANNCQMRSLSHDVPPKPEVMERDAEINPTGRKLNDEEKTRLQSLIVEYAQRKKKANEDIFITSKICESKAILAGDFETHPSLPPDADNSKTLLAATAANKKYFDNPRDENLTSLPGADYVTYRIIVLKPETSPEYVALRKHLRRLQAEEAIALRSFFLTESGQRR